jgi:hypothetical protein
MSDLAFKCRAYVMKKTYDFSKSLKGPYLEKPKKAVNDSAR